MDNRVLTVLDYPADVEEQKIFNGFQQAPAGYSALSAQVGASGHRGLKGGFHFPQLLKVFWETTMG